MLFSFVTFNCRVGTPFFKLDKFMSLFIEPHRCILSNFMLAGCYWIIKILQVYIQYRLFVSSTVSVLQQSPRSALFLCKFFVVKCRLAPDVLHDQLYPFFIYFLYVVYAVLLFMLNISSS